MSLRAVAAAAFATVVAIAAPGMLGGASGAAATSPSARAATPSASVVPVPGDRFAPDGTGITFRGVAPSALAGLRVVGSRSGLHTGTVQAVAGSSVFTPTHAFGPDEEVTVTAPHLHVIGAPGGVYHFWTTQPASPAAAARALRQAEATDDADAGASASPAPSAAGAARSGTSSPRSPGPCPVVRYHSEPDLDAASVCMNLGVTTSGTERGTDLFLTPAGLHPGSIGGAGIWTDTGQLIWWSSTHGQGNVDETVVKIKGQSYLAMWYGIVSQYGDGVVDIYNDHYQQVGQITAAGAFAGAEVDLHEFRVTPSGDALIGIYDPITEQVGGRSVTVLQYVVQEISLVENSTGIHTGSVLFEWDSLNDVPTSESHIAEPAAGGSWDYFHGNAISLDTDGNLDVSSRNTWGIFKVDDTPGDADFGHLIWQVGDTGHPQLTGEPWCFQHDITALGKDEYSLFDDGGAGPGCEGATEHPARALVITVDPSTDPPTLTLDESYTHDPPLDSQFTGSVQVLPNGDVLVGWGSTAEVTEYSASGQVKMDLSMTESSYRAFRWAWTGLPLTPPSAAAVANTTTTKVWASWNGATEVASWKVLAGPSTSTLTAIGSPAPKTGFETAITLAGRYAVAEVQALSSSGAVLGTSAPIDTSGYLLSTSAGAVSAFGNVSPPKVAAPAALNAPIVGVATTPNGGGYWLAAADGGVFAYGNAAFHGSAGALHLNSPIVGIAAAPDGDGYWLVAKDGGVFTYGSARFYGSTGAMHLNSPIVGMAAAPGGVGYWLVASDGGVFSFGAAHFEGSVAGEALNAPVVGIAAEAGGHGYWLVASDGGVFAFDAPFEGSAGALTLNAPIVGIAPAPTGGGYWLVASDGGVFSYGTSRWYGSGSVISGHPVVAISTTAG